MRMPIPRDRSVRGSRVACATAVVCAALVVGGYARPSAASGSGPEANPWGYGVVAGASTPAGNGYWMVRANGSLTGPAGYLHGSPHGLALNQPITGMAATPTGKGYWIVAGDGGIFSYGDARFYGSTGNRRLTKPV